MIVGDCFSQYDTTEPLSGPPGQELNRLLHDAKIMRSECYVSNVVNLYPPYGEVSRWIPRAKKDLTSHHVQLRSKYVEPQLLAGYQSLRKEIALVNPRVIIALGDAALYALTGAEGTDKWRGSILNLDGVSTGTPVIPTYHPRRIATQPDLRNIVTQDLRRARTQLINPPSRPKWKFTLRPSLATVLNQLEALLSSVEAAPTWIDFDLETRAGHIACAGLSWSLTDALCIPFMVVENSRGYWSEFEEAKIVFALYKLLTHPNCYVRWQNGLYDAQYTYRHWHFIPNGKQDTMITQHTLWAGLKKSLAFQASMYCDHYIYWKDDGKTWTKDHTEDQLWSYNCVDCVRTREVGEAELSLIESHGLAEVEAFQQRLFFSVLRAMNRGVRIDKARRTSMNRELTLGLAEREAWLARVLQHPINPRSAKQMQALFYEDLKQRPIFKRGKPGTKPALTLDDKALELISLREPILRPLIRKIQEMRSIGVFKSTFVEAELDTDGRMRCSYNICGTETYRFSSSENAFNSGTNLANIPKGGEDADSDLVLPNIRTLFIPDPGYTFFDTDLSKADLRIVVWESNCTEMKSMLAEGRDPYVETAREFYHDPAITKTRSDGSEHPKYRIFKSFSHGTHYLGTPNGLSQRLGLTVHEADRTQKWYLGKYPAIKLWQTSFIEEIKRTHLVTNKFGYRRHYFGRIDDSTFREAIAWLPQSTVAILINKIWVKIEDTIPQVQVLLQVHDSLAGQIPTETAAETVRAMEQASRIVIPYSDPLIIPVGIKTSPLSWGDC